MGLFHFFGKDKPYVISTSLRDVNTNDRQELLSELLTNHADLQVEYITTPARTYVAVTYNHRTVGTIATLLTTPIIEKYTTPKGLACSFKIGQNYKISREAYGTLSCAVELKVIPK